MSTQLSLTVINPIKRSCDDCTACCIVFKISDLNKRAFLPCKNLCGEGCSIYASRPKQCVDFECLYLSGNLVGDERLRPDNLGIVLYNSKTGLCAIEIREKAFEEARVFYLLNKLSKNYNIQRFIYNGNSV